MNTNDIQNNEAVKKMTGPMAQLEKDDFFKKAFGIGLKALAAIVILIGVYYLIFGLFGDSGFFKGPFKSFSGGFEKARVVLGLLLSLVLSAGLLAGIGLVLFKRSSDIENGPTGTAENYLPVLLKTYGEIAALFPIFLGLFVFFTSFLDIYIYNPLGDYLAYGAGMSPFKFGPDISGLTSFVGITDFKTYIEGFFMGLQGLIIGIFKAIVVLFFFYLLAELYKIILNYFAKKEVFKK